MSEDVKLEVIRTTQESLSKYIKKPQLTEKLLRKPPFRYLHDITTAVTRETGYLQGLFSQEELNPENIKDRDAKIAFLEKLIAAVNLSMGVNITARPNKIVAGLDVTKTNELLQAIGRALEKKVDSSEAVDLVLNKKTKGVNASKKEATKSKAADSKTREPRTSEALKKKNKEKTKPPEKSDPRKVKTKKDVSPTKLTKTPSVEEFSAPLKEKSKHENAVDAENGVPSKKISDENQSDPEPKHDVKPPPPSPHVESEPPTTTSGKRGKEVSERKIVENNSDGEKESQLETKREKETGEIKTEKEAKSKIHRSESKRDVRAQNNQRQEEKITSDPKREATQYAESEKENTLPVELERDAQSRLEMGRENQLKPEEEVRRPQSARAIHRKKPTKKPNTDEDLTSAAATSGKSDEPYLIETVSVKSKEGVGNKSQVAPQRILMSEPVNLIVDTKDLPDEEDHTLVTVEEPAVETVTDQVADDSQLVLGDQGHLVSQILETQKELEDTTSTSETVQKVDISWASGRGREVVVREVDKLRTSIQALTRAANPLGKLIDFLQEDMDSMQAELETWLTTNKQLSLELQSEERLTEESIEPLTRQLEDISMLVEEQYEEISVVKAAILRNDERILKLLKVNSSRPG